MSRLIAAGVIGLIALFCFHLNESRQCQKRLAAISASYPHVGGRQ